MIDDSNPWKYDLQKVADRLEKRKSQHRWTERSCFLVERDVMISAYAIRKLVDAFKLSDEILAQRVSVLRFALLGGVPDFLNWHHIDKYYDLNDGTRMQIKLIDFCNQVIHSFIWVMCQTVSEGFDGIIVSSDRERRRSVYLIDADTLIHIFRSVAEDEIVKMSVDTDENGEKRVIRASNSLS
jgi:hypothetical protein